MDARLTTLARRCLDAAETGQMTFPQIVGALSDAGFESYAVDLRRPLATYSLPGGDCAEFADAGERLTIADAFDPEALQAAIREAQQLAPGYSYTGFRRKAAAAGCVGYLVSFPGRRAVYFGRTGEVHTELFGD